MAKIAGSYDSLILGVSQQVPQDRREGQMTEQVNMISDPVRGLCRRYGSLLEDEIPVNTVTPSAVDDTYADIRSFKSYDFVVNETRYTLFYRTKARPTSSQAPAFFCINKETRKFVPVVTSGSDTGLSGFTTGGISAITAAGNILIMAGNTVVPAFTETENWDNNLNKRRASVWVRSGAYSRKYEIKVTIKHTGTGATASINAEFTTKSSSYPELLDTSDILATDPEYQKKVNDRTNAYNSAVTQWLGLAAADIVPRNIAEKLKEDLEDKRTAAGLTASDIAITISNSTIGLEGLGAFIIESLVVSDAGDGTHLRGVHIQVQSPDLLNAEHFPNQVVRIAPLRNDERDAYYLKAFPRDGSTGIALEEVTWREAAGTQITPGLTFCYATVSAGTLYVASTGAILATLTGAAELPDMEPSTVGDLITSPKPHFLGNKVTYLGIFQDRLVVGSNSVLTFSRPGDYLNFFRSTILSIQANDPVEIFSLGSEDDTLVSSTTYDQNLVVFGKRKQYTINGRQVLTPQTANITVFSAYEDAVETDPMTIGNFIFYTQFRNGFGSLHQIQPGAIVESPESYTASQQISRYINGRPVDVVVTNSPNFVFIKTEGYDNGLYLYNFLDNGRERLYDSWHRWEWDTRLGQIVGATFNRGSLLSVMLRRGENRFEQDRWFIALESFSLNTEISDKPYMDSLRPLNSYLTNVTTFLHPNADIDGVNVVFDHTVREKLLGQPIENIDTLTSQYPDKTAAMWLGYPMPAYFCPTNPYYKDQDGKAILNGIFTVSLFTISVTDTSGLKFFVETKGKGKVKTGEWNGRQIGRSTAELGIQPISTGKVSAPIGVENREFTAYIEAKDWLPLTVSSIEWQGQIFYNSRRG